MTEMSAAKTILAVTFVFLVCFTLVVPSFPPAPLLYKYLSIPQTTLSFYGISFATLLSGILNGFFWTIFAACTYGFALLVIPTKKLEALQPMPYAPRLTAPLPENLLIASNGSMIPLALTIPPRTRSFTTRRKHTRRPMKTKPVPIEISRKRTQPIGFVPHCCFETPMVCRVHTSGKRSKT